MCTKTLNDFLYVEKFYIGLCSNLFTGKIAADDLRLSALDLKPNFKLMMVGSLEVDIQDVQNSIDNRDVIDDFDDDNDERTTYNFHKMEVCGFYGLFQFYCLLNEISTSIEIPKYTSNLKTNRTCDTCHREQCYGL